MDALFCITISPAVADEFRLSFTPLHQSLSACRVVLLDGFMFVTPYLVVENRNGVHSLAAQ